MRNLSLLRLSRYASCIAFFLVCDGYAVTVQSAALNKWPGQPQHVDNIQAVQSAAKMKLHNPIRSHEKSSLGDPLLDEVAQQTLGQPIGTRSNWDFASSACLANNNINVPAWIIDGSGCGGEITVNGPVHIRACTGDMIVFVTTDTILRAGNGTAAIIVEAALGRTITFNLTESLTFAGGTNPLLVVLRGPGTIVFNIGDNKTLAFGEDTSASAGIGVQSYIIMEDPSVAGALPTVVMQRASTSSTSPVDIEIGANSFLTYAACTDILSNPAEMARLLLDPSNDDTGRMVLTIHDAGGLNIAGHQLVGVACPLPDVCVSPIDFNLGNFDRTALAGFEALFGVIGTSGAVPTIAGRMLVINENASVFEFQADPWCILGTRSNGDGIGCFSGVQYGFVLSANGVLAVDAGQTFDYVGLSCNICTIPSVTVCEEVTPLPVTCAESETCAIPTATPLNSRIKARNYSAFIVDGFNNPDPETIIPNASIIMCECSAMVFRSGVNCCCDVEEGRDDSDCSNEFTIPSGKLTPGAGEIVFDVEGLLDVCVALEGLPPVCELAPDPCGIPQQQWAAKMELLSLHVCRTGCPLLVDHTCCTGNPEFDSNYPARDFEVASNGDLLRYNKGQFLINNRMNLHGLALVHSDENHLVLEKNDVVSEPTYVGGESWTFCGNAQRPAIAFYNSAFFIHTNVAVTGLDLLVPNDNTDSICHTGFQQQLCSEEDVLRAPSPTPVPCLGNVSAFIFFQNGNVIDHGIGRQMVLGTNVGAVACDGCTIINADAHIDIKQENPCIADPVDVPQVLLLQTWPNNACINEGIFNGQVVGDIATQPSLHTVYLGHNSNVSIGADSNDISVMGTANLTLAEMILQGNFFAFASRGGSSACPALSNATGQGGVFVDFNGEITVAPTARVFMGLMVTKSQNGIVNLPAGQVTFPGCFGIANWQLNLADCDLRVVDCNDIARVVVVPDGTCLSSYDLNWLLTTKNYIGGIANPECENLTLEGFQPYATACFAPCTCAAVTRANVQFLPTIEGSVDTLQISGSRLGDQAYIAIRGCGQVGEIVNCIGCNSGEIGASVIVLGDSACVGIGSTSGGSAILGANGFTIIADGPDVTVRLNSDLIVDGTCYLLRGPNFCSDCTTEFDECVIRFESDCCRTIRVKSTGTLDLSSFLNRNEVVEFGGDVRIVLEPGAKIVWGGQIESDGGTLRLVDNASILCESFECIETLFQNNPASVQLTDNVRVKLLGHGELVLDGCSQFIIDEDAFVGVESAQLSTLVRNCIAQNCADVLLTDITITVRDQAQFLIGDGCRQPGGSFQVGNTFDQVNSTVNFTLTLDGVDALVAMGSKAFTGFGVGIAGKNGNVNDWFINTLFNLGTVSLNWTNGTFRHDRIYAGDDARASLLAISEGSSVVPSVYNFTVIPDDAGDDSNISQTTIQGGGNFMFVEAPSGLVQPNILDDNTDSVGILASLPLMPREVLLVPFSGSADTLFEIIRARDSNDPGNPQYRRTDVAKSHNHYRARIGLVVGTLPATSTIVRDEFNEIVGPGGATLTLQQATNIGAGRVLLDPNNPTIVTQVRVLT